MEINELQDKYVILTKQVGDLRQRLDNALKEIDAKEAELKKKSDLCAMYEHILDTRSAELDQMTNNFAADETRITSLEQTIDVLAARIAELKDGTGGR